MGPGARAPCPRDGFLVEEVTQTGFAFPVCGPRRYATCGYQDNLGFGFDTALGVKVAHSGKAVVSISGAGGFLFGVRELATAVQNHIDVVPVVFDNAAYGDVLRDQPQSYRGRTIGSKLVNPDFVALARSFGIRSLRVDTAHALGIGEADEKCSTNYGADEVRDTCGHFIERCYLELNPDVAASVALGETRSGEAHFVPRGHAEGRPIL